VGKALLAAIGWLVRLLLLAGLAYGSFNYFHGESELRERRSTRLPFKSRLTSATEQKFDFEVSGFSQIRYAVALSHQVKRGTLSEDDLCMDWALEVYDSDGVRVPVDYRGDIYQSTCDGESQCLGWFHAEKDRYRIELTLRGLDEQILDTDPRLVVGAHPTGMESEQPILTIALGQLLALGSAGLLLLTFAPRLFRKKKGQQPSGGQRRT